MKLMGRLFGDALSHYEHLYGGVLQLNNTLRALQACRVTGPQWKDHSD